MDAAQALGAIPVPLYQDSAAEEMAYVLANADVRIAIVEDQEQVDKLLEVKSRCPRLELIIYDDPRGLGHYDRTQLRSYEDVQAAGRDLERTRPDFFESEVERAQGSDVGDHALHLRHHRHAEGRDAHPRQPHRDRPGRDPAGAAHRGRGGAGLPADGLGGRQPLQLLPGPRRRVLRELSGEPGHRAHRHAGDRADLLLRPAARAGEPPHHGVDPDGGCLPFQALALRPLHGGGPSLGSGHPRWEAGAGRATARPTRWPIS